MSQSLINVHKTNRPAK